MSVIPFDPQKIDNFYLYFELHIWTDMPLKLIIVHDEVVRMRKSYDDIKTITQKDIIDLYKIIDNVQTLNLSMNKFYAMEHDKSEEKDKKRINQFKSRGVFLSRVVEYKDRLFYYLHGRYIISFCRHMIDIGLKYLKSANEEKSLELTKLLMTQQQDITDNRTTIERLEKRVSEFESQMINVQSDAKPDYSYCVQ
jgi:DNA repair exonuclease SbcCD ATPase subunit